MTNLGLLRRKLSMLRRRRSLRRLVCGLAPLGTAGVSALVALFALDFLFMLDAFQRAVACAAVLLLPGWVLLRYAWPQLRVRESELDTALHVQRQHYLDSELVAALQFDARQADRWGSAELKSAVVERARELSQKLDVWAGFSYRPMVGRAVAFVLALAVLAVAAAARPDYTRAFLLRLAWQAARYPAATLVQQVAINGVPVLRHERNGGLPRPVMFAEGDSLEFEVQSSGLASDQGIIELRSIDGRAARMLSLARLPHQTVGQPRGPAAETQLYRGRLSRLMTPLRYQIFVGDTWTDEAEIQMIARPLVELTAQVQPPPYVRWDPRSARSARQLTVPEGSAVRFQLACVNRKRIREAWLTVTDSAARERYAFSRLDEKGFQWALAPDASPLGDVRVETRFEIELTDQDGLHPEHSLGGLISVRRDRAPSAAIDSPHRVVLPSAAPTIAFQVTDDIAVAAAVLHVRRARGGADPPDGGPADLETIDADQHRLAIPLASSPITAEQLPHEDSYTLDLASLAVEKGDRVLVTLEVIDQRGEAAGASSLSDPLTFLISDEEGVLAAISQVDEQSERQLSEMIERQLEVGGQP